LAPVKEFLANSDQRNELIEDKLNDLKGLFKKNENPNERIEDKLDKLYDVMNHIRWIGLGIGGMFAITFIIPQCS
jgi:hypothetical protein